MNERIRELAEQAGFVLWDDEEWNPGETIDWSSNYDSAIVKYTELVVRECASMMEWQKISPKDEGAYNSALSLAQRNIKEHFGVTK